MEIKYLGHSSFLIRTKQAKLVTDPFDPAMVGLRFPKVEADIVTISHHHRDHDNVQVVRPPASDLQPPLIIDLPGEYEKNGLRIFGYPSFHDKQKGAERGANTLFKIEGEGLSVLHCGDLGEVLDDSFVDQIGVVDILLLPVGGQYTIDAGEAAAMVKKFEPSYVIPMHYHSPKLNPKNFAQLVPVTEFLKKMGIASLTPMPKLVVKKEELEEEMKVVLLEI